MLVLVLALAKIMISMYLQVFQGEDCRPGSLKGEANMNSPPFKGDNRLPAKEAER